MKIQLLEGCLKMIEYKAEEHYYNSMSVYEQYIKQKGIWDWKLISVIASPHNPFVWIVT